MAKEAKEKKPTKRQAAFLESVKKGGVLCCEKTPLGNNRYFLPDGSDVPSMRAENCIKRGWLLPNQDGMFGLEPQTYRAA